MRILLLLLAFTLPATLPASEAPTVLVVGDSLSAAHGIDREDGWVALLERRLQAFGPGEAKVVNASIGGDTTRGGLARLPEALEQHQPDIVIIELGGNDGLRGLPLQETRRNLAGMVERVLDHGARPLLLGVRLPSNYGQAFIERFQAVFREVANEYDIPLVPKFLAGIAEDRTLMQSDGIHPSAAAQPRMLDNVWPKLAPLLPETVARET